MPFQNTIQPEYIIINDSLRLRKYDGNYHIAIPWYEDELVRRFSEGLTDDSKRLDAKYVSKKLNGLNSVGEEYFIEVMEDGGYISIGVVTLKEDNPPIEIGVSEYRGKGIGKKVMQALVRRAREVGIKKIYNTGCYEDNFASQKMLEAAGFVLVEHDKDEKRKVYEIDLM